MICSFPARLRSRILKSALLATIHTQHYGMKVKVNSDMADIDFEGVEGCI